MHRRTRLVEDNWQESASIGIDVHVIYMIGVDRPYVTMASSFSYRVPSLTVTEISTILLKARTYGLVVANETHIKLK